MIYRVSTELRRKEVRKDGATYVYSEFEQCGSLYYFRTMAAACRAAMEMETSIVPMVGTASSYMDDYF